MNTNHLKQVNKTYVQHLYFAWWTSIRLFYSSIILFIHGICPIIFTQQASVLVKEIASQFENKPSRILIRFNTKWENDDQKRKWRVVVDGKEFLANKVYIETKSQTTMEPIDGIYKYHIECYGFINLSNNIAKITDNDQNFLA